MNVREAQLIDPARTVVATLRIAEDGDHYEGTVDLRSTPHSLRVLFDEFEEIVNGQMFSFLDEIQAKIGSLSIKVLFDDGFEDSVKDLQVFPSTGDVSFRLSNVGSRAARLV